MNEAQNVPFLIATTMVRHDRPTRVRGIALVHEAGWRARAASGRYVSHSPRQGHRYINSERTGKLEGAEEVGYGAHPVQLRMLHKQPKVKENCFTAARELKADNFVRLLRDLKTLVWERMLRWRTCLQVNIDYTTIQCVPSYSRRESGQGVALTTHPN